MNYDLLIHVDGDSAPVFNLAFNNAANYKAALPNERFTMIMVINGPAAKLCTMAQPDLARRAEELAEQGLEIKVCANALKIFGVQETELWPQCTIVPAGVVEIVEQQRQGLAYIKP